MTTFSKIFDFVKNVRFSAGSSHRHIETTSEGLLLCKYSQLTFLHNREISKANVRERSERDSEPKSGNAEAFQSIKRSNQRHKALKLNSRFFFFGSLFLFSRPKKEKVNKVQTIRKVLFDKLKCHVRGDYTTRKAAFTLAEVLITLGIIGVVAAMTLPTLLQNYQKKVTAVRLKHFSSLIQQANQTYNAQAMIKTVDSLDYIAPNDPNSMMDYFNIYLKPYIKVNEVTKKEMGLLVKLANGTGAYFKKINDCPLQPDNLTCETYIIFCTNIKYCENINEAATSTSTFNIDGKNSFIMFTSGNPPTEYRVNKWSRETLIEAAKDSPYYCSSLIEFDNWEIKDDNPCWK